MKGINIAIYPKISIPSPHTGRDAVLIVGEDGTADFNPLSPYGERLCWIILGQAAAVISIPSPHTGRDRTWRRFRRLSDYFNPLSPYGERLSAFFWLFHSRSFQSPLPIRGETQDSNASIVAMVFQSPLPIRGETVLLLFLPYYHLIFQSPLPIRGETAWGSCGLLLRLFQSPLPIRGETANTYSFSARKAVTFAQHRSKFGSREFFPAGEDLLFQRNTEFFSCEPDRKRLGASASHRI